MCVFMLAMRYSIKFLGCVLSGGLLWYTNIGMNNENVTDAALKAFSTVLGSSSTITEVTLFGVLLWVDVRVDYVCWHGDAASVAYIDCWPIYTALAKVTDTGFKAFATALGSSSSITTVELNREYWRLS